MILEMFLMILFHTINYEVYSELCNVIYKFCINMLNRILQQWDFNLLSRCIQVIEEGIWFGSRPNNDLAVTGTNFFFNQEFEQFTSSITCHFCWSWYAIVEKVNFHSYGSIKHICLLQNPCEAATMWKCKIMSLISKWKFITSPIISANYSHSNNGTRTQYLTQVIQRFHVELLKNNANSYP
jgi:hypothetical protein